MVLTCGRDNLLRLLDLRTFAVRATLGAPTFEVGGPWAAACLSPDAAHAAAGSRDGAAFVWDVGSGAVVARLRAGRAREGEAAGEAAAVVACAWSPCGAPLVSCDRGGGVAWWGPDGGRGAGG